MVQTKNLQSTDVGATSDSRNVLWIALSRVGSDVVLAAIALVLAFQTGDWQLYMMAGIGWGVVIVGLIGLAFIWRGRQNLGMWLIIGDLPVAFFLVTSLVSGLGILLGLVAIILTSLAASQTLPTNQARGAIILGAVSGVLVIVLDLFGPDYRLAAPLALQNVLLVVAGVLIFLFAIATARHFPYYSLRTKLIVAFLAVSILAVGIIAFFTNQATTTALTKIEGDNLKTLADTRALNIGDLMIRQLDALRSLSLSREIKDKLVLANNSYGANPAEIQARLDVLEQQWITAQDNSAFLIQVRMNNPVAAELQEFKKTFPGHIEIFVTDIHGGLLGTTQRTSDYYQADEEWWQAAYNKGQGAIYISHPIFDESSNRSGLQIALPFYDNNQTVLGILRSTFSLEALSGIVKATQVEQAGLRVDLIFADGQMLSANNPELEQTPSLMLAHLAEIADKPYQEFMLEGRSALASQAPVADFTNNPLIANMGWTLFIHQDREAALTPVVAQQRNTVLLAVLLGGLAVVAAIGLAQLFTTPIIRLTRVAEQVSGGDLTAQVEVKSADEIGALAAAFNSMTGQLRSIINTLEERVAERTHQLETLVNINQRLSGILDLSDLMRQVVVLTKETFNYYHVHIYLLDDKDNLIMTEGYGEVGATMRRQGHSIPLNASKSLVARAARDHRIITINDVSQDPDWLPNALLPETRSEMATPIILDGRVEGVLDVQSEKIGGLTSEDEGTLQTLANQIASVLRNARLFAETQDALYQAQRLQRLYTEQAWDRFVSEQTTTTYEFRQPATPALDQLSMPEALAALQQGKTIKLAANEQAFSANRHRKSKDSLETVAWPENAVATPLKLGEKIIGVLGVRDDNPERQWTEDEIALVETISEQMSLAIENARLFEATLRNAWRDRVVSESTASVWSSSDIEDVLKAAVDQLGEKLNASEVVIRLATEDELLPSENL
jgi:GAF domain-containing protein/HAMP domain-containing protein